jgi:1-acyl-sn-glycerol-3-phosphate acyltransferase
MSLIRSILFALFFYAGTLVAILGAGPAALLGRGPLVRVIVGWARFHRWSARTFLGIRSEVRGTFPAATVIVAAKHQSMFETIEFLLLLDRPAVVLKRELADLPGWGWAAKLYGVIPVDRDGGAAALRRMLKAAQAAVADGRPILIFPEGTRVAPGDQPPLQPGFAGLYRALGLPVVPVALDSGRLWPRHDFAKHPGIMTVKVGETIPPGLKRPAIEAAVHAAINELDQPSSQ